MTLNQYLTEISNYTLLTSEQELEVAKGVKMGNEVSRNLLINSNLRLVVGIAKKYSRKDNLLDLISEGNLALIKAVDEFDWERGNKFSTYASKIIKRDLWSHLDDKKIIKVPKEKRKAMRNIYQAYNEYVWNTGKQPTSQDIVKELNKNQSEKKYTADDVRILSQIYEDIKVSSLNNLVDKDGIAEYLEFVKGDDGRNLVKTISNKSLAKEILSDIHGLNVGEGTKIILERVLYKNKSFKEVSEEFGIKREQIRQKYSKGLKLLKKSLSHKDFH